MSRVTRRHSTTRTRQHVAAGYAVHPSDESGAEGADMRRRG